MKHNNILRIWCDLSFDTESYRELYDYCKANIGRIDEVIFFTQAVHAIRHFDDIKKRLDFIALLMDMFRPLGCRLGIDVLCTLGHHEEHTDSRFEGYDFYTDIGGNVNKGRLCSSSPKTMEYINQVYSYAASLHPDTIHIDDDLHYVVNCCCEHCDALFAEKGIEDTPENRRIFTKERLCNIFRVIENAVHSVDSNIAIGWMTCRYGEDCIDYTDYADALEGEDGVVLWRPGGGVYNDETVGAMLEKAHSIGRQICTLPDYVEKIYSEIENFPNFPLKKTAGFMTQEVLTYIAAGCTATAYNMVSLDAGTLDEYRPWLDSIDSNDRLADILTTALGRTPSFGIGKPLTDDVSISDAKENDGISVLGLPLAYKEENCCCRLLYLSIAKQLSLERLKEVLSGGVMTDGATLEYLNSLGLEEYTGFKAYPATERWPMEKALAHPLNPREGAVRNARVSFGWCPPVYNIEKLSPDAEYISEAIDFNGEHKGYLGGVYENPFGGRIYVGGYVAFSWFEGLSRCETLKRIFRYISRDTLPSYIASFHKAALFSRGDNIVLSNLTAGDISDVIVAVKTDKPQITVIKDADTSITVKAESFDGSYSFYNIGDVAYQQVILIKA